MPKPIQSYTLRKLQQLGVEVTLVNEGRCGYTGNGDPHRQETIPTRTVVWTAGVRGDLSRLFRVYRRTGMDGFPSRKPCRCRVIRKLYVVGDTAHIEAEGGPLPMVAQVAIQSAVAAAEIFGLQIAGRKPMPFRYHDRGSMITIGRNAAGAAIGSRTYTGFFA